jgi:hypothetical protein
LDDAVDTAEYPSIGLIATAAERAGYTLGFDGSGNLELKSDVTTPLSSTDKALVRFSGTGGALQDGQTIEDDSGNITVAGNISVGGTVDGRDIAADGVTLDAIDPIASLKSNLNASVDPTTTDDANSDYAVGSVWINTTTDRAFVCVDSTATAAIWLEMVVSSATTSVEGKTRYSYSSEVRGGVNLSSAVVPAYMKYHLGVAKAWVRFNAVGTVAIGDSHNVTSITDNGVGSFVVNPTEAMFSYNYSVSGMCYGLNACYISGNTGLLTATATPIFTYYVSGSSIFLGDCSSVCVTIHGDI